MFTGLVERTGVVGSLERQGPGLRLRLSVPEWAADAAVGASVAVNGCCLTVVECTGDSLGFDLGPETLARTNLGQLQVGSLVNLERPLRRGAELGGHFVSGHIDGQGELAERIDDQQWSTYWFEVPPTLTRHMAPKGSVAVDGVSLTLVQVQPTRFSVQLIPHTLAVTTLGRLRPGDRVNIETDILAKYVEAQLQAWNRVVE